MSDPFLVEIRVFFGNFAPKGWAFCNGQLMPISQNTAVFSLLGTNYGGDGRTNFKLPDLQEKIPVGATPIDMYSRDRDYGSGFPLGDEKQASAMSTANAGAKRVERQKHDEPLPVFSEIKEEIDQAAHAAELKKLAETLSDSQKQVKQLLKSQTEIVNHIVQATTEATEYQEKSAAGEFGEAGTALTNLVKTINAINRDPSALPKLESAIEMLNDAQERTQQAISVQKEIIDLVKTAATHVDDYRTKTSKGQLGDAGESLSSLMQTIHRLAQIWKKEQVDSPTAQPVASETHPGFLGASFIIALQGVFPERS